MKIDRIDAAAASDVATAVVGSATAPRVTVVTAKGRASKRFALGPDGKIEKQPGGQIAEAQVTVREAPDLDALAALLSALSTNEALVYGVPPAGVSRLMTQEAWAREGRPADAAPRTNEAYRWPSGPGVMMLDHDPGEAGALDREALVAAVREAAPGLADAAMLWLPSASSHIVDTRTRADLTGLRGQRLYLLVADAADIPRAGAALVEGLWAAGHGRFELSKAASLLDRTPVDASVWQPSRLDFAAGAECAAPLEQPVRVPGAVELIDTRAAIPDTSPETKARAQAARDKARHEKAAEARAAKEAWIEARVAERLTPAERSDPKRREAVEAEMRRAIEGGVLAGDFPLVVILADGAEITLTVGEALDDPARWHGKLTLDPLEPDYDGRRPVGKLYLFGASQNLNSFAHGGRNFRLIRAPAHITIREGRTAEATNAAIERLASDPMTFSFGGAVAVVEGGSVRSLTLPGLGHHLAGLVQFAKARGEDRERPVDPPEQLVKQVLDLAPRRLRPLAGVVTAPTIRPDGSIIAAPGYDEATGLFLDPRGEDCPPVPETPTDADALAALKTLWRPFKDFPFTGPEAKGAMLAALLTAAARPGLPTAPAFAMDAPVQGSGKTLLAVCVGALAAGAAPPVWPHAAGGDEEVRKRLFSALRDSPPAIVWDNVTGTLDSAALAGFLTSGEFRDRVLGSSGALSLPNRSVLIFTGNNIDMPGDMARRVVPVRIDPKHERPHTRRFELDPLAHVVANRAEMIAAALTLMRARVVSDAPRAKGRLASFEAWDDLVRQTVVWVGERIAPGKFADPHALLAEAGAADPMREAHGDLLDAAREAFKGEWFTARRLWRSADADPGGQLAEALRTLAGRGAGGVPSALAIGKALGFRKDRIERGLCLRQQSGKDGARYRVEAAGEGSAA